MDEDQLKANIVAIALRWGVWQNSDKVSSKAMRDVETELETATAELQRFWYQQALVKSFTP